MFSGSHARHAPVSPSKSSQQFTTRNGGSASATTATARKTCRHHASHEASHSAAPKPSPIASADDTPATSRLF